MFPSKAKPFNTMRTSLVFQYRLMKSTRFLLALPLIRSCRAMASLRKFLLTGESSRSSPPDSARRAAWEWGRTVRSPPARTRGPGSHAARSTSSRRRTRPRFSFGGDGKATLTVGGEEVLIEEGKLGSAKSKRLRLNPSAPTPSKATPANNMRQSGTGCMRKNREPVND